MASKIENTLTKIFDKHRLVFWYDEQGEFTDEFTEVDIEGVHKLEVNNELSLKQQVTREHPKTKYLLYSRAAKPANTDNWLLDLVLSNYEFQTDKASVVLLDLGIDVELKGVVGEHIGFFQSAERTSALKALLTKDDDASSLRMKLLAVDASAEPEIHLVLFSLFEQLAANRSERWNLIVNHGLEGFFWKGMAKAFGYEANEPGLKDLLIEIFKANAPLGTTANLNQEALVFLNRWQDSSRFRTGFERLSVDIAHECNARQALNNLEQIDSLIGLDAYCEIDQKIIHELVHGLEREEIDTERARQIIEQRRGKYWYSQFENIYQTIDYGVAFLERLRKADLSIESFDDGLRKYQESLFLLDQLYRKFLYHHWKAEQVTLFSGLLDKVENFYSNSFLLKLNDQWQQQVDQVDRWGSSELIAQRDFYRKRVQPYVDKDKKLFVVVSDALRYEVAEELLDRIRQQDRFNGKIGCMLGSVPSYTQLGMAALLPNEELRIAKGTEVLVDGQSSQGTENRSKALRRHLPDGATAIQASDFLKLDTKNEGRQFMKDHQLVYIYQNEIDTVGDKRDTEGRVIRAVEDCLVNLISILKKITNINGTNVLITADHGFIYQNRPLEESDFVGIERTADMEVVNRRFVIGRDLGKVSGMRHFTSDQVGLAGDAEFLIPKSINRLRVQGAGSRYVHGGTSLQEIVIPVIEFNKIRKDDTEKVEVDLIAGNRQITSGQVTLSFYQMEPVGKKRLPRTLRIAFYSKTGDLLSGRQTLIFDFASDEARQREKKEKFVFAKEADNFSNQEILLKLEEQISDTNQYAIYKEPFSFTFKKAFNTDFDF
jgi:uncharacterized protein (TIGR02687 family)